VSWVGVGRCVASKNEAERQQWVIAPVVRTPTYERRATRDRLAHHRGVRSGRWSTGRCLDNELAPGIDAATRWFNRTIWVRHGLTQVQRRCVLQHEHEHVLRGPGRLAQHEERTVTSRQRTR
jgi:hypothetical protein